MLQRKPFDICSYSTSQTVVFILAHTICIVNIALDDFDKIDAMMDKNLQKHLKYFVKQVVFLHILKYEKFEVVFC